MIPNHSASARKAALANEATMGQASRSIPTDTPGASCIALPPFARQKGQWLQQVQVAAALVISAIDTGREGLARRCTLLDLARGPMDWTVGTALTALDIGGAFVLSQDSSARSLRISSTISYSDCI